jgi:hypothetical protein
MQAYLTLENNFTMLPIKSNTSRIRLVSTNPDMKSLIPPDYHIKNTWWKT